MDSSFSDTIVTYFRFIFSMFWCCGTIFAPLLIIPTTLRDPFAHKRDRAKRIDFSILDISCLFVLFGTTLAVVRLLFVEEGYPSRAVGGMVFFGGLSTIVWWTSIRSLSRAEVASNTKRLIMMLVVTPLVWIVSFILPGSIGLTLVAVFLEEPGLEPNRRVILVVTSIIAAAILFGCRLYVRTIYSQPPPAPLENAENLIWSHSE